MENFNFNFDVIFNLDGGIVIQSPEHCRYYVNSTKAATDLIILIEGKEIMRGNGTERRVTFGTDTYELWTNGEFFRKVYMLLKGEDVYKFIFNFVSGKGEMGVQLSLCGGTEV